MIAMPSTRILRLAAVACVLPLVPASAQTLAHRYRPAADSIIAAALRDSSAWNRLAEMSDRFGHRLSGSEGLERAIDWIMETMRRDGFQNVRGEPVMVPHWVRGEESVELVAPRRARLSMLGLGGSIGTPAGGIEAEVLVVTSFDDLARKADQARGRIVLFDVPYTGYGPTVRYRRDGAVAAARVGAVASLIRSVAAYSIRSPHTGSMSYDSTVTRIPAAALSVEDAMMLHRMADRGERVVVRLTMGARTLPDAQSRNVMGELVGRERPHEVVVLGGHIDSWDVGAGAMDDGGGVVVAWEAVRLLQRLGLRPRRTIRVVGWTNEENGMRGATAYRDAHQAELPNHILAFESDGGVFRPTGFGFSGSDSARAIVREIASLLRAVGADSVTGGGGGADIAPIAQLGVPAMSPNVAGERYFWFHHSDGDTVDKLDPRDMAQCVAAFAVMMYVVADMPDRLPRGAPSAR
jgi:carboxypeptidase Q